MNASSSVAPAVRTASACCLSCSGVPWAIGSADGSLSIFEVKSGTKVKPRHVMDVALQTWVIESLGYRVLSVNLLHVNAQYRHEKEGTYPAQQLFKNSDVTERVTPYSWRKSATSAAIVGSWRTSPACVVHVRIVDGSRWPGRSSTETTSFVANLLSGPYGAMDARGY